MNLQFFVDFTYSFPRERAQAGVEARGEGERESPADCTEQRAHVELDPMIQRSRPKLNQKVGHSPNWAIQASHESTIWTRLNGDSLSRLSLAPWGGQTLGTGIIWRFRYKSGSLGAEAAGAPRSVCLFPCGLSIWCLHHGDCNMANCTGFLRPHSKLSPT